jgi:signal transduction histidine kinase
MLQRIRSLPLARSAALVVLALTALSLVASQLGSRIDATAFMPHGHCYLWAPEVLRLHVGSDLLIGLAYVSISFTLAYLVHRASRGIPFHSIFLAFGAFIITCGLTHFMEVWTVYRPDYWLAGDVKLVCAVASVATAVTLPPIVPRVLDLIEAAKQSRAHKDALERANLELAALYERLRLVDEARSRLFANTSHELRTPLALILGPAQKLAESRLPPEGHAMVETIERNANVLMRLVGDLLDVAKIEAGALRLDYARVDVGALVRYAVGHFEGLAREKRITLDVTTSTALEAEVDASHLERVLLNLLSNAFKFTPDGGAIRCRAAEDGDDIVLTVEDSGPGVPEALREAIFERFRQADAGDTRRFGGTGLGLSISRELVELHRGSIRCEGAEQGDGSAFVVRLPKRAPSGVAVADHPMFGGAALGVQTLDQLRAARPVASSVSTDTESAPAADDVAAAPLVVVVEDNEDMRRFVAVTLAQDYRVVTASDGAAGLELIRARRPDLVLTDVMMPAMSGEQLVRAIRALPELEATPIIVSTARAEDSLRIELLKMGAQDYLVKPFSADELRVRANNLVRMKRARDRLRRELETQSEDVEKLAAELAEKAAALRLALDDAESANRAKDEFLMTLSHELRTPLNAIVGWVQLLREGGLDEATRDKAMATIDRNAKAQTQLVTDLLDVSRIVAGKLPVQRSPLDLVALASSVVDSARPLARDKGVTLSWTHDAERAWVFGDSTRLGQVIANLLANALKFTPRGGAVHVALRTSGPSVIELSVTDNGEGIDPALLPHVWDRFRQADSSSTRRHGGLGLGLSIVKYLVEAHDGEVSVSSEGPGRGARFVIRLPKLAEHRAEAADAAPAGAFSPLRGMRVVVVDDDEDSLSLAATILERAGAEVEVARSGGAALAALERARADVLVTDLAMPDMDGFELIGRVRTHPELSHLPALALTAYAGRASRVDALRRGFDAHVAKPLEPSHLIEAVRALAASRPPMPA